MYAVTAKAAVALDAATGAQLWSRTLIGNDHEGIAWRLATTEHATPASRGPLPAEYCLEPSLYSGILTQLASNGSTTFAAVNDLALPATPADYVGTATSVFEAVENATGEMVAVNQDTGSVEWDTPLPSSPYGAALSSTQRNMIIAYKLGATGKLPVRAVP